MGEKMKILITGGSGFLASRIIETYKEEYQIYAPSHKDMDFESETACLFYMKKVEPEIVIHCGAISNTATCEEHPEKSYLVNVQGVRHIAKACKVVGAKLIFASSDQVYNGNPLDIQGKEEDTLEPKNVYGQHKLEAEKVAMEIADTVCLRLPWMCDREREDFPEHPDFYTNLSKAIEKKEYFYLPNVGKRAITNVNDIVEQIPKTFSLSSGIYNFSAASNLTAYEVGYRIVQNRYPNEPEILNLIQINPNITNENARNLWMDMSKIECYGIFFEDTVTSILRLF